ncbi:type IV secretory system conjugative DNA transfer family protein [Magnetospira sp. QH-2]|uniref:type IV secretory system conjugative DNA transfer family protein n=1 Tax=Magnetospira sp. (strain QH-2) TaxID=1288970 RepID=UPI00130E4CB6|nr:type IV secretory system conjugative DNA transfer family protein [Magnetospira sp. QH-2]
MVWGLVFFAATALIAARISFKRTDYGSARWGKGGDVKKMGLAAKEGIVLGQSHGKRLCFDSFLASIAWAPPGAGKTQILIMPSIFSAGRSSIVVNDPSGELYQETAGARAKEGPVIRLAWADAETARWNPLDNDQLPEDVNELQTEIDGIWHILIPKGKGENSQFDEVGRSLGMALTFYAVLNARREGVSARFAEIYHMVAEGSSAPEWDEEEDAIGAYLSDLAAQAEGEGWPRVISTNLRNMAHTAFRERSGYLNTMQRGLKAWENGHVANATSESDFALRDLRGRDGKPVSLYICLRERDLETFGTITRVFLTQLMRHLLSETKEEARQGVPINFLIDELPALGRMDKVVLDGPARGRKLRIRFLFVCQDPAQVRAVYGPDGLETLKTVSQYQTVFHQTNPRNQKEIADQIGQETRLRKTVKTNFFKEGSPEKGLEGQYLVRPEEIGMLGEGEYFVLAPHHATVPLMGKDGWAWKDRRYRKLTKIKPPSGRPGRVAVIAKS